METKTAWFEHARYGMFIHWGAYSVGGRGEWVMNRERIPKDEYIEEFVNNFTAKDYDPAKWARKAKEWGFGYAVLTTRHHDGFALWDSDINDFNSVKLGPKRDLVKEYAEALRAEGLKVGFYYSPASWTHPDYPGPFFRDWPEENDWKDDRAKQRFIAYYRTELRELLNNYGKVDYLWLDGCIPENIAGDETIKMIRTWQPDILINNRLGGPYDIKTCEQCINPPPGNQLWEASLTLNDSWGYQRHHNLRKNPFQVIELLLKCAAKCGNLMINVGPDADGNIPEATCQVLDEVGKWVKVNKEALLTDTRSEFSWSSIVFNSCICGNKVYMPVRSYCTDFCWAELKNKVKKVTYLANGEDVEFEQRGNRLFIKNIKFQAPWMILVAETEGKPEPATEQTTFWIPN